MPKNQTNSSWGGRFNAAPSSLMSQYTDSQHYDRKLYAEDILASKAHADMLAETGILSAHEASEINEGLSQIAREIETGKFVWKPELEDVHMNIEARLVEIIGDTGKKLHTARSRNDQVGLTFRLYVANHCEAWLRAVVDLCQALYDLAESNKNIILPGLTHLQPAQPVSLSQHLLAYANMFKRDAQRLEESLKRIRVSPLGACALAGTTFPINPYSTAKAVGFDSIYANSMDAVSDRDFVLEAQFIASVIMMHLSRLCEELILWANPAFAFIILPDEFSTGSSIMPQKKNPDAAELMRGKTGRVYGNLMAILTVMKGLPLSYNRDLQEDKEAFFDSDETVLTSLRIMAAMLPKLVFKAENMFKACARGFLNATELADYLVAKGYPFREAHRITGKIVATAERLGLKLEELSLNQFQELEKTIDQDIYQVLDYANCVKRRESPGGTGPISISRQLKELAEWLVRHESKSIQNEN